MSVTFADAISAYNKAVAKQGGTPLESREQAGGGDFAQLLRSGAESAIDSLRQSEAESLKAAAGKADINDVVTAVSQADIALQTVVAVRDRVVQAYQDILRMPI